MTKTTTKSDEIAAYIAKQAKGTAAILRKIRATVRAAVPDAEERISYAIPSFQLRKKPVLFYAAFENHVGVYPVPREGEGFDKAFAPYYTSGKGTLRFKLDEPVPYALIARIAKYRAKRIPADRKAAPGKAPKAAARGSAPAAKISARKR